MLENFIIPHVFKSGEPALADEVNENFEEFYLKIKDCYDENEAVNSRVTAIDSRVELLENEKVDETFLSSHITGLNLSYVNSASIKISSGRCLDSTLSKMLKLDSAITKVISNSLDTGNLTASSWYAVHIISNGEQSEIIFSLSATNPTLPDGYSYFRRIGWIFIQSDLTVKNFLQCGNEFKTSDGLEIDLSYSGPYTGILKYSVPPKTKAKVNISCETVATSTKKVFVIVRFWLSNFNDFYIFCYVNTGSIHSTTVIAECDVNSQSIGNFQIITSNSDVRTQLRIVSFGWIDNRDI